MLVMTAETTNRKPGDIKMNAPPFMIKSLFNLSHTNLILLNQRKQLSRPNNSARRRIARAFKVMLKGNWKWQRNYQEAMEAEDAKQWELAMKKEYDSIMKNETWTLVPRPKDAKVVKSLWVLRTKDNGIHKARFCAKGFTQRWGEDYDETFAPVAKYTSIRTLIALLAGRKKAKIHQMYSTVISNRSQLSVPLT